MSRLADRSKRGLWVATKSQNSASVVTLMTHRDPGPVAVRVEQFEHLVYLDPFIGPSRVRTRACR